MKTQEEKTEYASIYAQVIALQVEHDSHESDLYIPVNEITRQILKEHNARASATTFISQIDGKQWYDVPSAYLPWWERRVGR